MNRNSNLHPLSHQHHNGLMAVLLLKKGVQKQANPALMQDFVLRLWEQELRRHFLAEELHLNPGVLETPGLQLHFDRMRQEHARIREFILQFREETADARVITAFYELLEAHIRFEEREFFEAIQDTVPPEVLERAGKQLEDLPAGSCDTYPVRFWE
ncbi:MAG TPA: hemerythrin domain-containing protein [Lacibacter sp.]|nr:hemerythrin domain-containing protein [Lacibacter sp.]HMO89684.1 hemerythrin domain-containing protein [Lacibacter sp.]HMP87639.1 hemerythrin domain-containing protein [Lacibacter sp.]